MCSIALPNDVVAPRSALAGSRGGCRLRLAAGVAASSPSTSPVPKKKVVFADARGLNLTEIRWLTETPSQPPRWSSAFLQQCGYPTAQLTRGLTTTASVVPVAPEPIDEWKPQFSQPCTAFVALRRRLDDRNVALERCGFDRASKCITGTVKVRNLAFEKAVFVRWSSDSWKSHHDDVCKFEPPPSTICRGVSPPVTLISLYDTFSFSINPPTDTYRMELAVRFQCGGEEYWDSREGTNYILVRPTPKNNPTSSPLTATELEASSLPYW